MVILQQSRDLSCDSSHVCELFTEDHSKSRCAKHFSDRSGDDMFFVLIHVHLVSPKSYSRCFFFVGGAAWDCCLLFMIVRELSRNRSCDMALEICPVGRRNRGSVVVVGGIGDLSIVLHGS